MAPKGKLEEPKKVKASAEERTFGMKNKKGGAAQRQIKQIQSSIINTAEGKKKDALQQAKAREKKAQEDARAEAALLLARPAQIQKAPFGVDPKTIVCIFFKKGDCEKGKKCKFSHDLAMERKTEKKNLYTDGRPAEEEEKKKETSDDWDEEKLRKVVLSKKGNQQTTTDKVCKFFISAIEDGKYGWFWTCPSNGNECKYKHALPPGFVLKTKEQRAAEKALLDKSPLKTLTLEDFLESERHKLTGTLTPVTPESFAKWKKERTDKKQAEEQARKDREATGRSLFESGDWRFQEEEGDSDDSGDDDGDFLTRMRKETEVIRQRKEEERMLAAAGFPVSADTDANPTTELTDPPEVVDVA